MKKDIDKYIIAIDGYSSTGKSTYAKMLAKEFGWKHIDTGAMYRAVTLYGIENYYKGNSIDAGELIKHLNLIQINFKFNPETKENETYLNQKNVESEIRDMQVSEQVSSVAKVAEIRTFLVDQQRKIGNVGGIVMDGRDIGTVVFPNADLKFFITASVEVRAARRFLEFQNKKSPITLEEVTENLKQRDFIDENRDIAPLKKASDAYLIDNSELSKQETYSKIVDIIHEKLNI
ncbi:(d)CMP kinase [Apibacter sp. HY039]|uniref:(d)CMP kinase n=1 Tax=Apibacter sp. HY039 TaxID=2501476 RepID=UPI002103AD31|nr:(d)CMP kinase [Apibacter sp. HY039]